MLQSIICQTSAATHEKQDRVRAAAGLSKLIDKPAVAFQDVDRGLQGGCMRGNRSFGATMFAERVKGQSSRKRLTLLVSASISALCALSPDAARAQAVPPGCSPDPAVAGATVTCVVPAPSAIDPISTDVPDLTLVIGDTNTATTVADTGGGFAAISMVGGGDQTLDVVNAGSTITGDRKSVV